MGSLRIEQGVVLPGNVKHAKQQSVLIEAYDVIEATIEAGASDVEIEVLPSTPEEIAVLMIYADSYTEEVSGTPDLSWKPGAIGSSAIGLSGPLLLNGKGIIGVLEAVPGSVFMSNESSVVNHEVTILVGRKATP